MIRKNLLVFLYNYKTVEDSKDSTYNFAMYLYWLQAIWYQRDWHYLFEQINSPAEKDLWEDKIKIMPLV
jgi:hypothetical protein